MALSFEVINYQEVIHLLVPNDKHVEYEEILCFNCIRSTSLLSLANGYLFFKNLVYYLNIKKETYDITEKIINNIKPTLIKDKMSLIGLNVGRMKQLHYISINGKISLWLILMKG